MKNAIYFFEMRNTMGDESAVKNHRTNGSYVEWALVGKYGAHIPTSTLMQLFRNDEEEHRSRAVGPIIDVDYEEVDDSTNWESVMDCDGM